MSVRSPWYVCIYSPLVSWFISRKKFACGNGLKKTVLMERVVVYPNCDWPYACSFIFFLSISVLWMLKRHLQILFRKGKTCRYIVFGQWDSSERSLALFPPVSPSLSNIVWFMALGTYLFRERLWIALQGTLKLHLGKISFGNKCLGTWMANANALLFHHKM